MPKFVTCGPNEAIIVSGCCHSTPTIRAGGRVFIWPVFHRIQRLSLNTMTLNVESAKVHSKNGVPVTVKGIAQVKIQGKDLSSLRAAGEMFLDKSEDEIKDVAKATCDGHQRSVIASMDINDIYKKRLEFSNQVQTSAQADLVDMGLTLISYTIQEIFDDEGYLKALGQDKTVEVRSSARKYIAEQNSLAEKQRIETDKEKKINELKYDQEVALKQLDFEKSQAEYLKENFQNQARSEKAGDLRVAQINKQIAEEELKVLLLEKEKETEIILKKRDLKKLELNGQIENKADYECLREIELAEAYAQKARAEARIEAEKIEKLAKVRSEIITLQKEADAEVIRNRAEAFQTFGNAAKLEMVLAILPRLTAEIAGPISDCKKITSVSQDGSVGFARISNEIMEVAMGICESVGTLTTIRGDTINDDNSDNSRPGPSTRKVSQARLGT